MVANGGGWRLSILALLVVLAWGFTLLAASSAYLAHRDQRDLLVHGQHGRALVKIVFPHQARWLPGGATDTAWISFSTPKTGVVDTWLVLSVDEATRLRQRGPGTLIDILYLPERPQLVSTAHPLDQSASLALQAVLAAAISVVLSFSAWRGYLQTREPD